MTDKNIKRISEEIKRDVRRMLNEDFSLYEDSANDKLDEPRVLNTEEKRNFIKSVYKFAHLYPVIERNTDLVDVTKALSSMIETAKILTVAESKDYFDADTVKRHMKQMDEAFKSFEKTASEITKLQQRLEASYEDIGLVLNRYYDIESLVKDASSEESRESYSNFENKVSKQFK